MTMTIRRGRWIVGDPRSGNLSSILIGWLGLSNTAAAYRDSRLPEAPVPGGWSELPQQGDEHGSSYDTDQPQGTGLPNTSNGENPSYGPTALLGHQSPKRTYDSVGSVGPSVPLVPYDPPFQLDAFPPEVGSLAPTGLYPSTTNSFYSNNTYNSHESHLGFFLLPQSSQSTYSSRLDVPVPEENDQECTIEQTTGSLVYGQTPQSPQLSVGAQQQPSPSGAASAWQLGYNIAQTFHMTNPEAFGGVMQYIAEKRLLGQLPQPVFPPQAPTLPRDSGSGKSKKSRRSAREANQHMGNDQFQSATHRPPQDGRYDTPYRSHASQPP